MLVIALGLVIWGGSWIGVRYLKSAFIQISRPVAYIASNMRNFFLGGDQGKLLAEKDERIKLLEISEQELRQENEGLKRAVELKSTTVNQMTAAGIALYSETAGREYLLLKQGVKDGIKKGNMVIDENGFLLGTVSSIESERSKVDLAFNPGNQFEAGIADSELKVLAEGLGARSFSIKLIPKDSEINEGAFVILTAYKHPTIVIGQVVSISNNVNGAFLDIKATTVSRPEFTRNVFVLNSAETE